ncbi:MAG: hypothetical protein U5R49_00600 [Deltaproteobacteria bacterium]|nr:hypothetical protein [Deltaproteobacteria bacterium]
MLKHYTWDLFHLAGLIYELRPPQAIEEIEPFINSLPDQKIASLLLLMYDFRDRTESIEDRKTAGKESIAWERTGRQLLAALKKVYRRIRKSQMKTEMDRYRKGLLYALLLFLVALGSVGACFWGFFVFMEDKKKDATLSNLNSLAELAVEAKEKTRKSLVEITGSWCSICVCEKGQSLESLAAQDPCVGAWNSALGRICKATKAEEDCMERFKVDAWGSPYGLDQNEREYGKDDTRQDLLRSAGPDRMFRTQDDLIILIRNVF